jgi:hypothetical protein
VARASLGSRWKYFIGPRVEVCTKYTAVDMKVRRHRRVLYAALENDVQHQVSFWLCTCMYLWRVTKASIRSAAVFSIRLHASNASGYTLGSTAELVALIYSSKANDEV